MIVKVVFHDTVLNMFFSFPEKTGKRHGNGKRMQKQLYHSDSVSVISTSSKSVSTEHARMFESNVTIGNLAVKFCH